MRIIVSQIFALIAMILNVLSVQHRSKRKIMLFQSASNIMYTIQYVVLKEYNGAFSTFIASIRNICFIKETSTNKKMIKSFILIFLLIIFEFQAYKSILSLLPMILGIITILSACFNGSKQYKLIYGICSIFWIYYNIKVKAYICALDYLLCFTSIIICYIKEFH